MVTQAEIAQLAGIDVSSVSKILNRVQGPIFREETIRKVFQLADELGFSFEQLKHRHRKDERRKAGFPSKLALYAPDESLIDRGRCIVADIAIGGASITEIELQKGKLPLRPLTITLDFMGKGGPIEIRGQVVRMNETNGSLSLGIAFQEGGPAVLEQIAAVGG
jgi:transcriptional regulator with XRE-family HTH domain